MQHSTPAAPAVRETLERLLTSETFGRSERARELLRYLVERQQAGEAERLKGFSIAVDVFGKDIDFDSSTDAVVRVQAGRLRELLNQYFATEGACDPVRISIPRGSYIPTYELNAKPLLAAPNDLAESLVPGMPAAQSPAPDPGLNQKATPSIIWQLRCFWAAMALIIVMLGVVIVRQAIFLAPDNEPAANGEGGISTSSIAAPSSLDVLPSVYIDMETDGPQAGRVGASLRAGLSSFNTVDFIGRAAPRQPDPEADASSFVFHVLPDPSDGGITIELQNMVTGQVLLSRQLEKAEAEPSAIEDRIAGILTATLPTSGTIYNYIEQNGLQGGLTQCLLLDEKYYLDQNPVTHKPAYLCLEKLIAQGVKSPLAYSEIASLHMEAVTKHYSYPVGATVEQAIALARLGMRMGSTSASVHRSYGYINSRLGRTDAAIRLMRKAYELNTYDLTMAAAYGYGLIFAGKYAQGTPILARAVEASSSHPTWWDFGLFAGEFMQGHSAEAKRASDALTTTEPKSHYLAARIISATASGDGEQAKQLIDKLGSEFPDFVANPRKVFLERNYPADLTDQLVKALRQAGLPDASRS
ncbi:MAG TPA: hypothetical protein VGM46_07560 [Mesorhizobium sp.]